MKAHTFETYCDKYDNVRMRREDGILEVTLHTQDGPLVFNGYVHEALVHAFRDIGDDPDNHVVILTGTGDEFCTQISADGFDFFTPIFFATSSLPLKEPTFRMHRMRRSVSCQATVCTLCGPRSSVRFAADIFC